LATVFLLLAFRIFVFFVSLIAGGYPSWLMIRLRGGDIKGKISLKQAVFLKFSDRITVCHRLHHDKLHFIITGSSNICRMRYGIDKGLRNQCVVT
jgi:hypothetical protein